MEKSQDRAMYLMQFQHRDKMIGQIMRWNGKSYSVP